MEELCKKSPALEECILEVAETAQYLWERGWAERNAGNISVNIHDMLAEDRISESLEGQVYKLDSAFAELAGKCFFVTGTGRRMRDLARAPMENALIIRISADGAAYSVLSKSNFNSGDLFPTSELPTHLGIHQLIARRGSKEKVVIHTHATELIALTHKTEFTDTEALNNLLWGMHPETIIFIPKGVGFVPYGLPGSEGIARETIEKLQNHDMVIWEKHGVFAIGRNILETFDNIDIVCKSARIFFLCKGSGFQPEGLSPSRLKELKELAEKFITR